MVESHRPTHQRVEHMTLEEVDGKVPPTGKRGRRICQECEVECRRSEWQAFTSKEKEDNPDYALSLIHI
eukprot:4292045-Prorocentrum_lima.AAC.1